ncbi:large secreted protein [Streptomyces sp. SAT1]|uniref:FG-GAP-like repeat-containing protein n=1 Tax=Streptomyces sp. SAT1 TaxID=1849967 RepID=UPI0007DD4DAD|nr:FG-GAP-like repeat-containing protein [Streptomyces sp. SAT1]ANH91168.1 large secreted protein [Streptomyces sp. SAT1]
MRTSRRRPWHSRHRRRTLTGAAALAAGSLVLPLAVSSPVSAATAGTSAEVRPDPVAAASRKAAETGERVEVTAKRTEDTEVYANPDGSFTEDRHALPERVRKGHRLVPIDATLQPNPDGTLSTRATTVDVTFSGGGAGPMATVTRDGRSLSLTWPTALPAPVVAADSATYPDVLPGVDLKLQAGAGGFAQLLVVKTPEAAANPKLKDLQYGMSADGVDVKADPNGNLTAVNPAGQEVFTSPTPRMWDSSTAAPPQGLSRTTAQGTGNDGDGPDVPTGEFEPGYGAKQAAMDVKVTDTHLSVTPDQSLLTAADTHYPVYIDPVVSGGREAWTIAYKKYPNSSFYNGVGWGGSGSSTTTARVGYENETNGLAESYFRMDSNKLWDTNKQITKSTFRIKNTWSWSCTDRVVEVGLTGSISSATTWNKRPSWARTLSSVNQSLGWGSACPAGNLAFDVTSAAKDAASKKWPNITLGMRAANESDVYAWKKFDAHSAVLSTDYNTVPDPPTGLYTSPDTGKNCGTTTPYTVIGNTDITLGGKFTDSDDGTIKAHFILWPTGHGGAKNEVNSTVSTTSGTVSKLVVPKAKLAALLKDAGVTGTGTFTWYARAEDATASSAFSAQCHFQFDGTRPSHPPTVTSVQFPDGTDGWPENTSPVRTAGTFTLGNGGVSDVAKYEYWTDWDPTVRTATPATAGGSKDVTFTPVSAGPHFLYARSIDHGNNTSDRAAYLFYVKSPNVTDKPGDLNGDGNSDLYGVRTDGALWQYSGSGNGSLSVYTTASTTKFNGASITHRGDWTGDGYEDLIALTGSAGSRTLQLYPNNGYGYACTTKGEQADSGTCTADRQELTVDDPADNHWQNADQVLAIGDVDGPLDVDDDGVIDVPGFPDLLVKEGNLLWLYYGASIYSLDAASEPVLIGNGGWSGYDLIAPGDVDQDGNVDILAREKSTGALYLYPGTGPTGAGLASRVRIGTGWTPTSRPLIASGGDADNDGKPDLWATSPDTGKGLYFYPAITPTTHGTPTAVGTNGWDAFEALS